jgi:hypothetical protein
MLGQATLAAPGCSALVAGRPLRLPLGARVSIGDRSWSSSRAGAMSPGVVQWAASAVASPSRSTSRSPAVTVTTVARRSRAAGSEVSASVISRPAAVVASLPTSSTFTPLRRNLEYVVVYRGSGSPLPQREDAGGQVARDRAPTVTFAQLTP